jgi:DNA-binding MurR/RpiR family transcriptional regulator
MVLEKIRGMLPDMPPNFRKIGSYILDHEQSVAFSSIYDLSAALGVSSSTLVRFAQSLGMNGYAEFKRAVQDEIKQRLSPYEKIALSELDVLPGEKRLQKLFQNEVNNLRTTFDNTKLSDLEAMAVRIRKSGKIFISGFGVTSHLVRIFEYTLLSTLNKDVSVITGSVSDYSPRLKSFSRDDLMFLMTFPPYSSEVRHVAKAVKERGGTLYLFTDSAVCPVYPMADTVIKCDTNSLLLSNSFVGLVSTLHILVHLVYLDAKDIAIESRRRTIEIEKAGYRIIAEPPEVP